MECSPQAHSIRDCFGISAGDFIRCRRGRRAGSMLIHGAITAWEYGLHCVTGIPDLTCITEAKDIITVDGYL